MSHRLRPTIRFRISRLKSGKAPEILVGIVFVQHWLYTRLVSQGLAVFRMVSVCRTSSAYFHGLRLDRTMRIRRTSTCCDEPSTVTSLKFLGKTSGFSRPCIKLLKTETK